MADNRISQQIQVSSLEDTDLIPLARVSGSNYINRAAPANLLSGASHVHQVKLTSNVAAAATSIDVDYVPEWVTAGSYVYIDVPTVQCEVRKVDSVSSTTINFTDGLSFEHSAADICVFGMEQIFNIWFFGSVGDDSTPNHTFIQAAIDEAPNDSQIYFPDGDFVYTSALQVHARKELTFWGPGVLKPQGCAAFDVQDSATDDTEEITWDNLHIIGDGSNVAAFDISAPNGQGVRRIKIVFCEVDEFQKGVSISSDATLQKIQVLFNQFTATDIASSVGIDCNHHDNLFQGNIIRGFDVGIAIMGRANHVIGNHIWRTPSTATTADITVGRDSITTNECAETMIRGNYLNGQPGASSGGYIVVNVQAARNTVITANHAKGDSTAGPFVLMEKESGGAWHIQKLNITNNIFRCASGTMLEAIGFVAGVRTEDSENFDVHGNTYESVTEEYHTRGGFVAEPFTTSFTPKPFKGRAIFMTLTDNITVNQVGNTAYGGIGNRILFIFRQDGTGGRTVSFHTNYRVTWDDTGNTAGEKSAIEVMWDGQHYMGVGAQTPYV